jgi:hypothetical protein
MSNRLRGCRYAAVAVLALAVGAGCASESPTSNGFPPPPSASSSTTVPPAAPPAAPPAPPQAPPAPPAPKPGSAPAWPAPEDCDSFNPATLTVT